MADFVKIDEENSDKTKATKKRVSVRRSFNWRGFFILLIVLFLVSSIISSITYSFTPKIAVVPINGPISTEKSSTLLGESESSRNIANTLREIQGDSSIKAVILDINSPGGSPVASEEISRAIDELKLEKPVYALINDVGASGAFWIAVSADKVYASSMSTVGSIGVTSATLGFEELIEEYNITYRRLVAGDKKDLGSPFREPTQEENELIQGILDEIHTYFIQHVATSRNMSYEEVEVYATGEIFLGSKAKEIGFVDEIGYFPDVLREVKEITDLDDPLIITYEETPTLLEALGIKSFFAVPETKSQIMLQ
ncbi:MAG: signal peptide peptidase SppA [Candidatus Woesearchaeota archaeon]|jgi:protease-4|nr:signal peptide peptidase SppA [Candidatus Woesearchaeota archaeon]